MSDKYLSRFTPSLMTPEALEAVFIQREELATRTVSRIRESASSKAKHHIVLVGPRGIGKTHIISLIYHRIKQMSDIDSQLKIAWLREEEWGVASLLDLFLRILKALLEEHDDEQLREQIELLYEQKQAQAEISAGHLLKEYVGEKKMLLITENMDELFNGLGNKGQQKFRAYLQENPFCCILATSPSLFNGISLQNSPFYGFFSINHLENLTPDDAINLLVKIANYREEHDLAIFLASAIGRARIRAVHHLAGGNPRIYVIFSQFLTRDSLDQLVDPFMQTIDDLTPYYQSRMSMLSPQQRKIVELLCAKRHAVTVKEIAKRCFITHQTTSGQLKKLRQMRYVRAVEMGRESYYELSEPLMRLCLEVKKQRGGPIRLFVDFLRLWYSRPQLEEMMEKMHPEEVGIDRKYIELALRFSEQESDNPVATACMDDFTKYAQKDDWQNALRAIDDLIALKGNKCSDQELELHGTTLIMLGKYKEASKSFANVVELNPQNPIALGGLGLCSYILQKYEKALHYLAAAIENGEKSYTVLQYKIKTLIVLDRHEEALRSTQKLIKEHDDSSDAWALHSKTLYSLGQRENALVAVEKALSLDPSNVEAWEIKTRILGSLQRLEEALSAVEQWLIFAPENHNILLIAGHIYFDLHRYQEAIEVFSKLIDQKGHSILPTFCCAYSFFGLHKIDEGKKRLDEALTLFADDEDNIFQIMPFLLLKIVFNFSPNNQYYRKTIKIIEELHAKHDEIGTLSAALLLHVKKELFSPLVSSAAAHAWNVAWQETTGSSEEMNISLKILDTAVRYKESQDKRILMELATEEREILEQLLEESEEDNPTLIPTIDH